MSYFEKILLVALGALCVLTVAGGGISVFLTLSIFLLAIAYVVGGYWMFQTRPTAPAAWLRIISGLCLAAALLELNNSIRLQRGSYEQAAPALLGLLCTALTVYLVINRRQPERVAAYRPLLVRSAVVFAVCAFFAYGSINLSLSRAVLLVVNQDKPLLKQDLLMFEYTERTEAARKKEDYAEALLYARKAYTAGNEWLAEDSITERYRINGVYVNLYKAYRSQGDADYNQQRYLQALRNYQLGYEVLTRGDYRPTPDAKPIATWLDEEAWSLNNMAYCYLKTNMLRQSDSLFVQALNVYNKRHPQPTAQTAVWLSDLAKSQAAGQHLSISTLWFKRANQVYARFPSAEAHAAVTANRLAIAFNYLNQDSLPTALLQLQSIRFGRNDSASWAKAHLYESICRFRQSQYSRADSLLRTGLRYYQAHHPAESVMEAGAKLLLAKNCLAQAEYARTESYATEARTFFLAKAGASLPAINCTAVLAALSKALGKYDVAARQYAQVLAAYQQAKEQGPTHSSILTELADLDITLGDVPAAKKHIAAAFALVGEDTTLKFPSQMGLLTTAAYVDYVAGRASSARTRYAQVLRINHRFGQASSLTTAAALNGLGLLETEQQGLARADSLFAASLALHQKLVGEQHPLTATVYLNYGLLRARQHRLPEAEALIQRARQSIARLLPPNHDLAADLYAAQGDVAAAQAQDAAARTYYQQALRIYEQKFSPTHWKVKRIKRKLTA